MVKVPSISVSAVAGTALGAGVLVGAGIAYLYFSFKERTRLTKELATIHANIQELRQELARNDAALAQGVQESSNEDIECTESRCEDIETVSVSSRSSRLSKRVTFSSASGTYYTALDTDNESTKTANDTDYFSPDEDEDVFFDLSSEEESLAACAKLEEQIWETKEQFVELFEQVDRLMEGSKEDQVAAFKMLQQYEEENKDKAEFQWRIAKSFNNLSVIEEKLGNEEQKKDYIFKAYDHAERAIEMDDSLPQVHEWYAIMAGRRGDYLSNRERIASAFVFKEHIEKALQIDPTKAELHYLLGRFCYEIASVSVWTAHMARALYGEFPSCSYDEALQHFLTAEKYSKKQLKDNKHYIAKCCLQRNEVDEANEWVEKAYEVPIKTPADEIVQQEIEKLRR
ncbi:regulator of microtubule dynamics protein 1-like isoform X2 [Oratosquilla oratoria]|uniref:regulator of microtubule dynamics protein 1-like isoform X2 n=1 Tax=Oratosquilla oratoria TaxID=337810 RepID=UPI003F76E96B